MTGTTVQSGNGWYYDDFSPNAEKCGSARPQRISFTSGDEPAEGRQLHIECLQTITGSGLAADINTPCAGDATACDSRSRGSPGVLPPVQPALGGLQRRLGAERPLLRADDQHLPDPVLDGRRLPRQLRLLRGERRLEGLREPDLRHPAVS